MSRVDEITAVDADKCDLRWECAVAIKDGGCCERADVDR